MATIILQSTFTLANKRTIPILGLGVWKIDEGAQTEDAVLAALRCGYRHIDTAKLYGNEASVGSAVRTFCKERGVPRKEIFVTTKLWPTDFFKPEMAFNESLGKLGLEYIDLYLIHWPAPIMPKSIWQALEKVYDQGLARAIGVSNYSQKNIEKVLEYAKVAPMVNQVEFNPKTHDLELLEFCKANNIIVEAYSPLGQGSLLKHKTVLGVAERYKKTPAQILIRWALQHGTVALPKSSNEDRIKQNIKVFDFVLSPADMEMLNTL